MNKTPLMPHLPQYMLSGAHAMCSTLTEPMSNATTIKRWKNAMTKESLGFHS